MDSLDPEARGIFAEGRQLYVGVVTKNGPHVTPELYASLGDDLWFATAATTLKAKAVRRDGRVGAMVRVGSRAAVVTGEAEEYDVADPLALLGNARDAMKALQAVGAFTLRNAADLGGFARDLVAGRLPSRKPPRRVLVRLRPDHSAVVDAGGLPGDRDAVLGWSADGAPLVLPARCDDAMQTAWVPGALPPQLAIGGEPAAACLAVDAYVAPGPAAKTGLLRRGTATPTREQDVVRLELQSQRDTTWDGAETRTVPAP
ncbi:MAG TPA: pyridoxamine 5'-phosphate oxidase family protein [Mycobacteriales bacterium]|nr:pyridoxamine 5'-phosphate oxidase family protein [Mycobacteriales bacterium]